MVLINNALIFTGRWLLADFILSSKKIKELQSFVDFCKKITEVGNI
jgi:hypothetical protein